MIKIIQNPPDIKVDKMSLARIFASDKAFGGSPIKNDLWGQFEGDKMTSLISMSGGSINLYSTDGDKTELKSFLEALCPTEIFTEFETAEALGLVPIRIRNMLTYTSNGTEASLKEFALKELYDRLSYGSDVDIHLPSFEIFAPDVSHRLRHNGAIAVIKEYGAALAFTYSGGAAMTGIALSPAFRGQGLGKKLLNELLEGINGNFFVAANDNNTKFYLNFGFSLSGRVGYWRLK